MSSKTALMILGLILVVLGILGVIPATKFFAQPTWYGAVELVIGLIAVYLSAVEAGK